MSVVSSDSRWIGIPSGYRSPARAAGYVRFSMKGIWVAVKATTSTSGSSRYTVLKLWKSRPAAPMMSTRRGVVSVPKMPFLHPMARTKPGGMPGLAWATDLDLRITWVMGRPLGRGSRDDLVGVPLEEAIPMGGAASIAAAAHRQALGGSPSNFEFGVGGRTFEARVEALEADGLVTGVAGMAIDVTERRMEDGARRASDA